MELPWGQMSLARSLLVLKKLTHHSLTLRFSSPHPLMKNNLRRKTNFDGRHLFREHNLWWKMTFVGRQPFDGRQPLMEDALWWKVLFEGRQPLETKSLNDLEIEVLKKTVRPNSFWTKKFWTKNVFQTKICFQTQNFFRL